MNALRAGIAASAVDAIAIVGPGTVARRYRFAPGFPGFSGHFPGEPILPAIVQLMTVVSLAGEHAGIPLRMAAVRAAKFLAPIRPDEEITVRCDVKTQDGMRLCDATLTVEGRTAATALLHLADPGESP
ncbi:MAG TPA: hypothetical protein VIU29_04760 [Candidatus Deferrimicrobiaceae bacterium]